MPSNGEPGDWASGSLVRSTLFGATRKLTIHLQQRIIRVEYEIRNEKIDHVAYARALGAGNRFPQKEGDASSDFEDLAADLHAFGRAFLAGKPRAFIQLIRGATSSP